MTEPANGVAATLFRSAHQQLGLFAIGFCQCVTQNQPSFGVGVANLHSLAGTRTNDVEAAMGPRIGAAVVANHYKLDSALTSLMVGIGIPLSLLIAPLWLNVANLMA